MDDQSAIRELLIEQMTGRHAHVSFDQAIKGLQISDVGSRPEGLPHSIWELVEHIRISQNDILEFSRDPDYKSPSWPKGYWPENPEPGGKKEWEATIEAFHSDHEQMVELIKNPEKDLLMPLPHGSGQTLFREAMLIVDHNSYHIGQIIQVRRLLGSW